MAGCSTHAYSRILVGATLGALTVTHTASLLAQTAEQQLPEIKVRSGRDTEGYNAPTATSATKIEAPLRDIPQTTFRKR
jgi:catecholate siderophore receptor